MLFGKGAQGFGQDAAGAAGEPAKARVSEALGESESVIEKDFRPVRHGAAGDEEKPAVARDQLGVGGAAVVGVLGGVVGQVAVQVVIVVERHGVHGGARGAQGGAAAKSPKPWMGEPETRTGVSGFKFSVFSAGTVSIGLIGSRAECLKRKT